ncbi:MAG TPA: hypothetical protein VK932_09880 [Kofleriaceae bacterium]|nr:hypothetical protein [Kofleriaceae bacterium]
MESILTTGHPRSAEQIVVIRAFERLESQIERLECQMSKVESHFHSLKTQLARDHGRLLELLLDNLHRLQDLETQLTTGEPPRPPRPPADAAAARKAA